MSRASCEAGVTRARSFGGQVAAGSALRTVVIGHAIQTAASSGVILGWPGRTGRVAERQDASSCGFNRMSHSQPRCGLTAAESRWRRGNARAATYHKERHLVPAAPARQRRTGHPVTFRHQSRDGPYIHVRMAQPWDASLVASTREMLSPCLWPSSEIDGLKFVAGTRQASCDCVAQTQKSGPSLHQRCPFTAQQVGPVLPAEDGPCAVLQGAKSADAAGGTGPTKLKWNVWG